MEKVQTLNELKNMLIQHQSVKKKKSPKTTTIHK